MAILLEFFFEFEQKGMVNIDNWFWLQISMRTWMWFFTFPFDFLYLIKSAFFKLVYVFVTFVHSHCEVIGVVHEIFELVSEVEI